jgi:hypothetical protein
LGVPSRVLCEAMHAYRPFGRRVRDAEKACVDDCKGIIYEAALKGSVPAAVAYCKIEHDREAAKEALRQGREHLKSERKIADRYARTSSVNMSVLDDDELNRFSDLHAKFESGVRLDPGESSDYLALVRKIMPPVVPPTGPDGTPQIACDPGEEARRLFLGDED